jgi:mannose/fructose/N-acetylgalactosamine-specific phosphotransferase system component IIC
MDESEDESVPRLVGKFFVHGLLYSLICLGLYFVFAFVIVGLVLGGLSIGLIIGLVLLMFALGWTNVFLMDLIWDISAKEDLLSLFIHGLLLVIVFALVSIPIFIVNLFIPSILTTIVLFIIYCFIDGLVAMAVGSIWEEGTEDGGDDETGVTLTPD